MGLSFQPRTAPWLLGCWAGLLLATGCSTGWKPDRPFTGDPLVDGPYAIANGPPRDRVLWQYRMASAAMRRGQFELATSTLDAALARLGSIYGPDADARKARSLFGKEAKKTFLGEPYERAMAWYYRGILYWRDGEPDNARACFRSAAFMDADAAESTYAGDYVLPDYLDGWITKELGGDGTDALQRAAKHARWAIPPPPDMQANVLLFIEYGQGPRKYAAGEYGEQLRFREGSSAAQEVKIRVEGQQRHVGPYDDLYFQATTRGGRVIDHVLGNKAVFKSTTDTLGTAAVITGAVLASDRNTQEAGLAVLGAGVLAKIVAAATTPEADTRTWDNLPLYLSFASFQLAPGNYAAQVEFLDANRAVVPSLTKTVEFTVAPTERHTVLFVSDQSINPLKL